MPIEETTTFIIGALDVSASRGGWQATGWFANDQIEVEYGRRLNIYINPEGGGVWTGLALEALAGNILPQSIGFDYKQSNTVITLATTNAFLQNAGLQGIYFTQQAVVTNPHQYVDLRLATMIQHIIEQHTNVSSTAFIQNSNGTFSAVPVGGWVDTSGIDTANSSTVGVYTVKQNNSLWEAMKAIAANEFYVIYMDKYDNFIVEQHPQFKAVLPAVTVDLDSDIIINKPEVLYRDRIQVDQVRLAALTDEGEILRAEFPANVSSQGRRKNIFNLRCNSQARLNTLAERAYLFENREFTLRIEIPSAWGTRLELYDRISVTYVGTARNGVTLNFAATKFWIDGIRVQRISNFSAITEVILEQENLPEGSVSVSASA